MRSDYNAIFTSPDAIHNFIYGDRTKTADIIFGEEFLTALNGNPNQQAVDMVIRKEAVAGDIPSLIYMIQLLGLFYADVADSVRAGGRRRDVAKSVATERVMFVRKAVASGFKDQAYYGMASSTALWEIATAEQSNDEILDALLSIVEFGEIFLQSGYDAPELMDEVKKALEHWRPIASISARVCR